MNTNLISLKKSAELFLSNLWTVDGILIFRFLPGNSSQEISFVGVQLEKDGTRAYDREPEIFSLRGGSIVQERFFPGSYTK